MNQPLSRPRRLLIVTYHIPPSSAVAVFRMLGFAQHLPRCGWQVGFVAPPRVPGEPLDEALAKRVPEDTTIFPVPYPNSLPVRVARRWLYHGVWLPRALPAVMRAVREFQPDAVMTSGPPHCVHVLGMFLKRFYGLPWLASFRDPWFTNIRAASRRWPWAPWERFLEKRVFEGADCIIANTPLACQGIQEAFPRLQHKMSFVTNGFDPECFPAPKPLVQLNERLTILHAGELYAGRDPRPFFDVLRTLENARPTDQPPLRVRLLGQSTENLFDLREVLRERRLENIVEVGGQVPYAQALEAMTQSDVLLLIDTPGRKISIPAKLFEYLGAARPILALTEPDGDVAWALRASGMPHRVAPALDAAKIHQALLELRDGLAQKHFALPSSEQLKTFTRAKLAQELAGHLNGMVAATSSAPASAFGDLPYSGRRPFSGSGPRPMADLRQSTAESCN